MQNQTSLVILNLHLTSVVNPDWENDEINLPHSALVSSQLKNWAALRQSTVASELTQFSRLLPLQMLNIT